MIPTGTRPGIYPDMTEATYRADPAVNQSAVKPILHQSPAHAIHTAGLERQSKAMDTGTVLDQMILTPSTLKKYVIMPSDLSCLNQNKREVQDWKKEQRSLWRIIITQDEKRKLENCVNKVWSHPEARKYLCNSRKQVPGFCKHEATGLMLKGLVDIEPNSEGEYGHVLVDCKSTRNAQEDAFLNQALKDDLIYHLQAAQYSYIWSMVSGRKITKWVWIVYEAEPPHGVSVIKCRDEVLAVGRHLMETALEKWAACVESGKWPNYPRGQQEPEAPNWFYAKYGKEIDRWITTT